MNPLTAFTIVSFSSESFQFCSVVPLKFFFIKIAATLLLVIHYPRPCGALFTVKILSHIATAVPIHLMSGFEEQLKALFLQLRFFDVRELDIPPDLEHSPWINTVVWRLTCRALYSLNTEIHTAWMTVPSSLFSPPLPSFIHCFPSVPVWSSLCERCSAAACAVSRSFSGFPYSLLSSFYVPFHSQRFIWTEDLCSFWPVLVSVNCMGLITKAHLTCWKGF